MLRNYLIWFKSVWAAFIKFAAFDSSVKFIYEYEQIKGEPHVSTAKNINPYLVEGNDIVIYSRRKPLSNAPETLYGSKPVDDGNFFFTNLEKIEFLKQEPEASKFIKPFLSAKEFLHNELRWCLWLKDADPNELRRLNKTISRIEAVKKFRFLSTKEATKKLSAFPSVFAEVRQPISNYILIPLHTSENRRYIPFGFFSPDYIVGNSCTAIPNANQYHFGILSSLMHMKWVENVCGRMKSDYSYSTGMVYNNFPWPLSPTDKQKATVEAAAQAVLDARAQFPQSSLADLYDPNTMPPVLVKAHQALDKAVDLCYRPAPFPNETKRIEFLFELYDTYTAGLFVKEKKGKKKAM